MPWLEIGIACLGLCGLVGGALLGRLDRAGTGVLLGALLGPIGLVIVLLQRRRWAARDRVTALQAESRREEQAWREWRGYRIRRVVPRLPDPRMKPPAAPPHLTRRVVGRPVPFSEEG